MTIKEARRRLAAAERAEKAAREKVRDLNASVVKMTREPPRPLHYETGPWKGLPKPDMPRRLTSSERAKVQELLDQADRASRRLFEASDDVVHLRALLYSLSSSGASQHATKKRPAVREKRPKFRVGDRVSLASHMRAIPAYADKPFVGADAVLRVASVVGKGTLRDPWAVSVTDDLGHFWHMDPDDLILSDGASTHHATRKSSSRTHASSRRWIVMEFHGKGDPMFGGGAADRVLGKHGLFLTGAGWSPADYGTFPSEAAALRAAEGASNRRPKGLLLALPK